MNLLGARSPISDVAHSLENRELHLSASQLRKLPMEERDAVLAAQAALAEPIYRSDKRTTAAEPHVRSQSMKSPFPGMDPYLERHWGDVHQSAITYIRDWLQPRLPGDLRARTQERVFIDVPDRLHSDYCPDVRVVERPGRSQLAGSSAPLVAESPTGTETAAESWKTAFSRRPSRSSAIPISSRSPKVTSRPLTSSPAPRGDDDRVARASPTSVLGRGRRLYLKKRKDQRKSAGGVNLVEIDLCVAGSLF